MEMGDKENDLRKLKLEQLEPALRREILEFAATMGYEATITSSSSMHFVFELYQAERAKEKKSRESLEKAEDLILRLSSLHHDIIKREDERRRDERKKKLPPSLPSRGGPLPVSKKTRDLLGSIGIEDEGVIEQAVGLFGDAKVEERVELAKASNLGEELLKKVFGAHPETILIPKEDDFASELDSMEIKRAIIDDWAEAREILPPPWADYERTPGILLDTYHDISRLLALEVPEEVEEPAESGIRYMGKPMDPDDFLKVALAMGFEIAREAKHGTLLKNADGDIMCVQKGHRKQQELNASTIKKKLNEARVDLDRFEEKRREMRL